MITLTYGVNVVTLNPDMQWTDEMDWHPVQQTVTRTLTGGLVIESSLMQGGRPITLASADRESGHITGGVLRTLQQWAGVPDAQFALAINGTSHTVVFRHVDTAIEATPVVFWSDMTDSDFWFATLRFMEV